MVEGRQLHTSLCKCVPVCTHPGVLCTAWLLKVQRPTTWSVSAQGTLLFCVVGACTSTSIRYVPLPICGQCCVRAPSAEAGHRGNGHLLA